MGLDGGFAEPGLLSDLGVRSTGGELADHLQLTLTQQVGQPLIRLGTPPAEVVDQPARDRGREHGSAGVNRLDRRDELVAAGVVLLAAGLWRTRVTTRWVGVLLVAATVGNFAGFGGGSRPLLAAS